ncbi:RagB/SusD family nutrient uptake outer membrane protein [Geofilum sp. OHC36d9]|uniref:RagB/SusD family nutrient uptake outer membrane protein n=1 Tax=Geofilum sp. OHC36d9 TaxID=3458413 RepID=UPI0040348842
MKHKNKVIRFIQMVGVALLLSIGSHSCNDYLDVDKYVYDITVLDSVFVDEEKLLGYINGIANYLPDEDRLWTNSWSPYQGASDENFFSWNDGRHAAIKFLLDEITPATANYYYNNYATWYKGIRKANTVLARMDECEDLSVSTQRTYTGEMYFFRGYFLYLLLQQYGPVPLPPDELTDFNDEAENLMYERNSYDQCVDYIIDNMEQAISYLPSTREGSNIYRPTSGAALAVQSRVLLTAASPLFNGNSAYSDWTRQDGTPFISQTTDNSKWGRAAVAARRLMETGLYKLNVIYKEATTDSLPANVPDADFPDGAGDIDPYRSYKSLFNGEVTIRNCAEYIWACEVDPRGGDSPLWLSSPSQLGGGNGLNLTLNLIDAYKMKDGFDINQSSADYPYPGAEVAYEPTGQSKSLGGYTVYTSGTARMYANREPRFYATIGFSHSYWPGTSYTGTEGYSNYEVTYYSDGTAGPSIAFPDDYNHTGYTCIKYNHPEDNMRASGSIYAKWFPLFRYAEILLNYAEALNELEAPYTDEATGITVTRDVDAIRDAVNRIRYRAGQPGLSAAELSGPETIRAAIKHERQVEFACEGRRYHDLRRWLDAPEAYNQPIVGMNVRAKSSEREKYYTRTTLNNNLTQRTWSFKMYFWPIPKSALDKNSRLVQNPGW